MLFTLIKNELIKLMKKSKTWIVFALFATFILITIFVQYRDDKNMRIWNSPERQLKMAQDNLKYYNEELESNKETDVNPEYIAYLQDAIENSREQIKNYEYIIKNGLDEDAWKIQLDQMIEYSKQTIENYKNYDDEWSKRYLMQEQDNLEIYNYLRDNNIEPLYGWEYEAYNYMTSLMQFLGAGLLVCGIAVFMSDIVSGECTPATLKFLLVQPVTRGKVLLSKFIAVTLTVITMILGAELIGFVFVNLTSKLGGASYPVSLGAKYNKIINSEGIAELVKVVGSGHIGSNLELFVKSMLFQGLFIVATCSVVFLISTLIKSSMVTMALSSMLFQGLFIVATCSVVFLISTLIKSSMVTMALSVVVTVFLTIASQLMVTIKDFAHLIFVNYADGISILTGSSALTFNNPNMTVQNGIIIMIATSVISYIIAHINFTRKDILI